MLDQSSRFASLRTRRILAESLEYRVHLSVSSESSRLFVQSLDGQPSESAIVVTSCGSNAPTVQTKITISHEGRLLQAGDSPVAAPPPSVTLSVPHALDVQMMDVNGDGYPDLLMVRDIQSGQSTGRRQYVALLNDGDGGFSLSNAQSVFAGDPDAGDLVSIGDVNGDGLPDCLVRTAGLPGDYHVELSSPDGTWSIGDNFRLPPGAVVQGMADLDGDGLLDLVYVYGSQGSETVGVALGNGDGTFSPGLETTRPEVSNFVLVSSNDSWFVAGLCPLSKDSTGSAVPPAFELFSCDSVQGLSLASSTALPLSFSPSTCAAMDVDGDGVCDLVCVTPGSARVYLAGGFDSSTPPTFTETDFSVPDFSLQSPGAGLVSCAAGDVDGDGSPDLVALCAQSSVSPNATVCVAFSAQYQTAGSPTTPPPQFLDPVSQSSPPLDTIVQRQQVVRSASVDLTHEEFFALTNEGDLTTGNTRVDVVSTPNGSTVPQLSQSFLVPHVLEARCADFTGDGTPDLLLVSRQLSNGVATGKFTFTLLDGKSNYSLSLAKSCVSPVCDVLDCVGDLNGDGRADLVIHRDLATRNVFSVMFAQPNGTFKLSSVAARVLDSSYQLCAVADLNKDKKGDFVFAVHAPTDLPSGQASGIVVAFGNGNGDVWRTSSLLPRLSISTVPFSKVSVSDFHIVDGSPDIGLITDNSLSGGTGLSFTCLSNLGKDVFRATHAATLLPSVSSSCDVLSADLNGDGRADLLCTDGLSMVRLTAVGDPTTTGKFVASPPLDVSALDLSSCCVVDVTRDGLPDVACVSDSAVTVLSSKGGLVYSWSLPQ